MGRHHVVAGPDPDPNLLFNADPDPEPDSTPSFTHVRISEFFFILFLTAVFISFVSFSDTQNWRLDYWSKFL